MFELQIESVLLMSILGQKKKKKVILIFFQNRGALLDMQISQLKVLRV